MSYIVESPSREVKLTLNRGAYALDTAGNPLGTVSIDDLATASIPAVPSGATFSFAGHAVTCSPEGATFSPSLTLTFTFTEVEWNTIMAKAGQNPSLLVVKWYNPTSKEWVNVQTSVNKDAKTVSATIKHFSTFGLFVDSEAQVVTPVTTPVVTPVETMVGTPVATTVPPATPQAPVSTDEFPWMYLIIGVIVILLIAGGAYYYTKKP
jgi:hypothetical protein